MICPHRAGTLRLQPTLRPGSTNAPVVTAQRRTGRSAVRMPCRPCVCLCVCFVRISSEYPQFSFLKKVKLTVSFLCCYWLTEASGCGENWAGSQNRVSWSTVIQDWYSEVNDWRYGVGTINGNDVGHFTQVRFLTPTYLSDHRNRNIVG